MGTSRENGGVLMDSAHKIATTAGEHVRFGKALGTRRLLGSSSTSGGFGLVEHDLPVRQLGSPIHTHEREDEYSFVLSGQLTAQVGDGILIAGPGEIVVKPRRIPHAFWNASSEPVRFLELICPGGFEEYFFEMAGPFNAGDVATIAAIRDRYRLTVKLESIPELLERHGLQPPF
jgi:mannose-6-phosphate isomerase-like protein (cupin superfamily)